MKRYIGLLKSLNSDPELDYMESYSTDVLTQAAYVSSDTTSVIDQSQLTITTYLIVVWGTDYYIKAGQSFQAGVDGYLTKCSLGIKRFGSRSTTNVFIELYAASSGLPTGNALATSDTIAFDSISATDATLIDFTFSDVNLYELIAGNSYTLVQRLSTETTESENYLAFYGTTNVYNNGMCFSGTPPAGDYTGYSNYDLGFRTYIQTLQSYSESTIKTQGSYSLKGVAAITDSLNKTLTRTVDPPINCSGMNHWKTDVRALRLGSNFKITLRDAGGTLTEVTPNIAEANEFQTEDVDISAVADVDKDAINQIKITILDATAPNTIYLDNMFAEFVPTEATYRAQKGLISGYHCFMKQYIDYTKLGLAPLKLPDGTLW